MRTNTLTYILAVTAAGTALLAFARDGYTRERSASDSDPRSMSGTRSTAPFQTAPGASAPAFSIQTAPSLSRDASPVNARSPSQVVRQPYITEVSPTREANHISARTAAPTVRQTDATASYPTREANPVSARTAAPTVRQPDATMPSHERNSDRMSARDSAPAVRQTDATASYPTREASHVSARTAAPTVRQPDAAAPAHDRDSDRMSTRMEPAANSRTEHARKADVAQARSTPTGVNAPTMHEAMDGRSDAYRASQREHSQTTAADVRHDLRPANLSTPHPLEASRAETSDRIASRTATPDRNRLSSAMSMRSPSIGIPSDGQHHAFVNRSIVSPAFHGDHQPRPSSFAQRPYPYAYQRDTYRPWRYPVVYPIGWGLTWSTRSFFASFSAAYYAPVFTCADYSYTPCYTRWHNGYYGSSYAYYGGWRHGWYGGFSYVCNPWPVYSTYYFCDPPAVVTRSETVYVTQPAVAAAPIAEAAPTEVAAPPAFADPAVSNVTAAVASQDIPADQAPADLWGDYGTESDDFTLDFVSYAETMNAEKIWASYSELNRSDPYDEDANLNDETAALTSP